MNIEVIWQQYRSQLKRFLHSKIANEAEVEDLLQEILIRSYNNLDKLSSQLKLKSWLFSIANNAVIDFYRKSGKQNTLSAEDTWYYEETTEHALAQCVTPFINCLASEQAELLNKMEIEGQSQKEFAKQHGIPYSTLKSRVKKAREQLKIIFDKCCELQLDKAGNVIDCESKNSCSSC